MSERVTPGPFHEGERLAQRRASELEMADKVGGLVKDVVTGGALAFLEQQELVVVATEAPDGSLWSSLLFGGPGFVRAPGGREVVIDLTRVARANSDPFWNDVREQADLGLLAIDMATRRRLRVNLRVTALSAGELRAAVREAYPNCPKYIQRRRRRASGAEAPRLDLEVHTGSALDADRRAIVERADTFFLASHHPARGADASHRGGRPGFARVVDAHTLRIPDYAGNGMYNSLGNLLVAPRVGVAFVDFDAGRVLQMTGAARVLFDRDDPEGETGGTGRFWEMAVERWVDSPLPVPWRWDLVDFSPHNPP